MLQPIVMEKVNALSWWLMPKFLERIRKFSTEFTVTGFDNAAPFFETCFGSGDTRMLGLALLDKSEGKPDLVGHLLAGCESYLGVPHGVVYQFSKDKGVDFLKTSNEEGQSPYVMMRYMVESWARAMGINSIYALVEGPARAKLFGWFGFDDNMRIVKMHVATHVSMTDTG